MLDNAAWKDTTHDVQGRTISVQRGSVCASTRHIAKEVGVGHQIVRTALDRFQLEHMINTASTHGKNVVTLCNYEKYQDPKTGGNTAPNTAATQQQHTANTQKEQGNKLTKDTNVSLDASASEILSQAVSQEIAKDFIAARREMKKPVTERAARSMVKDLIGHHDPNAVIRASISNGWQGIFPDKIKPPFKAIDGGHNGEPTHNGSNRLQRIVGTAAAGTSGKDWG